MLHARVFPIAFGTRNLMKAKRTIADTSVGSARKNACATSGERTKMYGYFCASFKRGFPA
jgi:hypothetical protein